MTESNDGSPTKSTPTLDGILRRMKLTNPGDQEVLLQIIPWVQTQRPKFMFTSVLGLSVLILRMGRAFAMRSQSGPVPPKYAPVKKVSSAEPAGSSTGAPEKQQKPKRKAFRSAKKLDLSPNVVASLKGFVADLAATIPLIFRYAEHKQQRSLAGVPQLTAVDTIEVCLHMMEGEVATNQPNANKELPNAAMELYRKILDKATNDVSSATNQNAASASTMDQLKFKTFCCKTLESAQTRAVSVVEALYDFRLLWNIVYEQQRDLDFVPKGGTSRQQEELAWKLAYYIVWRRQEEHPELCDRRERILASAISITILCSFPLAHCHPNTENPASQGKSNASVYNGSGNAENENNKRPMEGGGDVKTPASKILRVGESGDVHDGHTAEVNCEKCEQQERAIGVVLHAIKQALSFSKWAQPKRPFPEEHESSEIKSKSEATELERKDLDRRVLEVVNDLLAFSKYEAGQSNNWMDCLKATVGIGNPDEPAKKIEASEEDFVALLEDVFVAMQRDEDERMGTRVEAVPYIEELALMKDVYQGFTKNLCKTTNDRRGNMNELIACVPVASRGTGRKLQRQGSDSANISEYQPKVSTLPLVEDANDSVAASRKPGSPPVITEAMELNEWTIAILSSLNAVQPSPNLKTLLAEGQKGRTAPPVVSTVIVPLLNRYLSRMQQASGNGSRGAMPMTIGQDGKLVTRERTEDTQLWAVVIQLYYHSLESLLFFERSAAGSSAAKSAVFHEAMLACCYLCAARAMVITGKMQMVHPENHQVHSILPIAGSTPYSYLKVTESFLRAQSSSIPGNETSKQLMERFGRGFPRILQREVKDSEMHVLESLLWVRDNGVSSVEGCIVNTIAELKQNDAWPPACLEPTDPDEVEDSAAGEEKEKKHKKTNREFPFVSFVMRKLLKVAIFRINSICEALGIPSNYPVSSQVFLAFRFLLRNQVELLYGRHLDQWILCTIYGICRMMKYKPGITFGKTVETYISVRKSEIGETVCSAIVRHVKILDAASDGEEADNDQRYGSTKMGSIINLYNLVFVPIMKSYMLHSKTLKRDAEVLKKAQQRAELDSNSKAPGKGPNSSDKAKVVRAGNVKIQFTLSNAEVAKSTAEILMNQEANDLAHEKFTSFLQFGSVAMG